MPRKKKPARELTTDEAMKRLFPKKVRDELYRIAHEKDDPEDQEQPKKSKGKRSS